MASLARETAAATATAMFDFWRCSCSSGLVLYLCSRAAEQAAPPQAAPDDPLAAEKLREAIRSLETALGEWGGRGRD